MPNFYTKFTGKVDRRSPNNEGDPTSPILRENWLPRDGCLNVPPGHVAIFDDLPDIPRWMGRYHSIEVGATSPKSFVYTEDGAISILDDVAETSSVCEPVINANAISPPF